MITHCNERPALPGSLNEVSHLYELNDCIHPHMQLPADLNHYTSLFNIIWMVMFPWLLVVLMFFHLVVSIQAFEVSTKNARVVVQCQGLE